MKYDQIIFQKFIQKNPQQVQQCSCTSTNQSCYLWNKGFVPYNKFRSMIPTFTLFPNPMIPLATLCNLAPQSYFQSFPFINCSSRKNPFLPYIGFNFGSRSSIQALPVINQYRNQVIENGRSQGVSSQSFEKNISDFIKESKETKSRAVTKRAKRNHQESSQEISKRISKKKVPKIAQNKNRNIIPSIIQQTFSYLSKPSKSRYLIDKIFPLVQRQGVPAATISRYFYFLKHIKQQLNHYLNKNSVSLFWKTQLALLDVIPEEEQAFYLNVARRAAKHFLQDLLPLLIIHSKRMFEEKRTEHLKVRRILLDFLHQRD